MLTIMAKKQFQKILILFFGLSTQCLASVGTLTLEDAYQLALKRSEDVQIQEEQINQAEEKLSQAKGGLFPTINAVGTFLKQDHSASFATSPTTQNTMKLNLTQPLFKGLRDFALIRQQGKNLDSVELNRDQAKTQLFSDVSQAYYQLLTLLEDLKILSQQKQVNEKRLSELKDFRKIGRSRETDVLALDANIAAQEANIEAVRVQLESAWGAFSFLTGLDNRPELNDREEIPSKLIELSEFQLNVKNRPDLKALESTVLSLDDGISVARGGHFPTVDFLGNYYFDRPGVLAPVKWDIQLAVVFPIFQGGVVQSQVRQASSLHQQAEIQFEKLKRQAVQQISMLYQQIQIEVSQEQKQKLASDLAQKNYQAELKDSRLGLVTNLDVLLALSNAQDSLRLLNRIHYQIKIDYLKLLAYTAERPKR